MNKRIKKIRVCQKTELIPLKRKGQYHFYITDEENNTWRCSKKALHEGFIVGEEAEIILNMHHLIIGIKGFTLPNEIIEPETEELPPSNRIELSLYNKLTSDGWDITRRGWPDFACFKDGKFIVIEVKPKRSHRLKTRQMQMMKTLMSYGIPCYRWSPDGKFEKLVEPQELKDI